MVSSVSIVCGLFGSVSPRELILFLFCFGPEGVFVFDFEEEFFLDGVGDFVFDFEPIFFVFDVEGDFVFDFAPDFLFLGFVSF